MTEVVTRFAPSPTGFLHIGGVRTALFNWLYARHAGGTFLLRIEDTDRKRSTPEAIDAILEGLSWLGLHWDGEPVFQYARRARHAEVAKALLDAGHAYRCYCTPEELAAMRERAKAERRRVRYDGTWRDRPASEAPEGVDPVIRFRAPVDGVMVVEDMVQGSVAIDNAVLDDLIMLRADGTPTYTLSVVVDDHDMGVTHVIRGDDHLNNAARQAQLFHALGWDLPAYAHIPLIHGADGAKLSKRHGALGVEAYRDMGFLPQALLNYLCRLGWSHGDDEVFSLDQAVGWFDVSDVNRGAARFDLDRLSHLNGLYLSEGDDGALAGHVLPVIEREVGTPLPEHARDRIFAGIPAAKARARTLVDLAESLLFYARPRPLAPNAKAAKLLAKAAPGILADLRAPLGGIAEWNEREIEDAVRAFAADRQLGLGAIAQPLRAALTGSNVSPGIFEVAAILGRDETLGRIADATEDSGAASASPP